MKLRLASLLFIASAAFAQNEGSYATVTSTLTITNHVVAPAVVLKNGNKQFTATQTTFKVTNAALLAECQRQGILTAGSVAGWRVYGVFGRGSLAGFYISNGVQTVAIPSVLGIRRNVIAGFTTKGKWQENTVGDLVSGGTSYHDGFLLDVTIDGVTYTSTVVAKITDKVVTFGALGAPVWRPAGFKVNVAGLSTDDAGVMQGGMSFAAAKSNWNLGLSLLGFPGFAN